MNIRSDYEVDSQGEIAQIDASSHVFDAYDEEVKKANRREKVLLSSIGKHRKTLNDLRRVNQDQRNLIAHLQKQLEKAYEESFRAEQMLIHSPQFMKL